MKPSKCTELIGQPVIIEWLDANGDVAWQPASYADLAGLVLVRSVGILLKITDSFVVTATDQNTATGDYNGWGVIPTANIVSISPIGGK